MHRSPRGFFRVQRVCLLKGAVLLPLVLLLGGCLITPYKIVVPPLPSVHTEEDFELYYLDGPMPAGTGVQSGHASRCMFVSDKDWIDNKFRENEHAQACDDAQEYFYDYTYQNGRWVFDNQAKPRPTDTLPDDGVAGVPRRYVLCRKSGSRVESLNTTLNSAYPRVKLKDRGCEQYLPPTQQGVDLYYLGVAPTAASGEQTLTAQLCGSYQQQKSFDFWFRRGGHSSVCRDTAQAWEYYEFVYDSKGHWLLKGGSTRLPQPELAAVPASSNAASRRYVICKRVGSRPGKQVATAEDSRISPPAVQTSCTTYQPPAFKPRER